MKSIRLSRFVFFLLFSIVGCTEPKGWGSYQGTVEARWSPDGRTMTLLKEIRYTDPSGLEWIAPTGATVDGASIPRPFWSIVGGPFEGLYRDASVLHDVACVEKTRSWKDVHRMFYTAMRCRGVGVTKAKAMYYAVYRFGPRWHTQSFFERWFGFLGGFKLVAPIQAPLPTEAEVSRMVDWIEKADPNLEEIESKVT